MRLSGEHREHLRESGLSDETIDNAGIYSANVAETQRLGYPRKLAGICFPYPGTQVQIGEQKVPYTRLRVDAARQRSPGQKYENPLKRRIMEGLSFYPYIPPGVEQHRKDFRAPVFITEGEKKALKLTQEGFPTIGLPGVFMFHDPSSTQKKNVDKPLHPDLLRWQWRGRTSFVCFDSDRTIKDSVALAHERLCAKLTAAGALVRVVQIPNLDELDKTGADDFLVRRSAEEFRQLVDVASPWEPFEDLLALLPDALPSSAVPIALAPARARLREATRDERRLFTRRLLERYPKLETNDILDFLENTPREDRVLPEVVVNNRQTRDIVRDAWRALRKSPEGSRVFLYGERLVMVPEHKARGLQEIDVNLMEALLNRSATWVAEKRDDRVDARVPSVVPRDMIALPDPRLSVLRALTRLPILRPDGSLQVTEGLDPESGLFLFADEAIRQAIEHLPLHPSSEERAVAVRLLLEDVLGDFPFVSEGSRAHAVAAVMLPLVRHLIHGETPLHLIAAPTEGTGKTLLADVVSIVATGRSAARTAMPQQESEVNKTLTALLVESSPIILLDNITRAIDSPSIAAATTGEEWSARLLGQSRMVKCPNLATWMATANNPTISGEIARRTLSIRLDAEVQQPWLREGFRHPNLRSWLKAHRGLVIAALVTLYRGWLDDGGVAGDKKVGSFEAYSAFMGGILASAGIPGFLSEPLVAENVVEPEEADWQTLVEHWAERFGEKQVSVGDLIKLALEHELCELDPSGSTPSHRARLGKRLQKCHGRIYGPWRISMQRDKSKKQNMYALVNQAASPDHP